MNQSIERRSLLKLFGVGAVVVPVVDGLPLETTGKIISPGGVQIIERAPVEGHRTIEDVFCSRDKVGVVVFVREKTGNTFRMDCSAFMTEMKYDHVNVSSWGHPAERRVAVKRELTFVATSESEIHIV